MRVFVVKPLSLQLHVVISCSAGLCTVCVFVAASHRELLVRSRRAGEVIYIEVDPVLCSCCVMTFSGAQSVSLPTVFALHL